MKLQVDGHTFEGPDEVPFLDEMTVGRRNLDDWRNSVFDHRYPEASLECLILLYRLGPFEKPENRPPAPGAGITEIEEALEAHRQDASQEEESPLTDWSDTAPAKEQADLWNRVLCAMGYTK